MSNMNNMKKTIPTLVGGAILLGNVSVLATEDMSKGEGQNQEVDNSTFVEVTGSSEIVNNEVIVVETMENIVDFGSINQDVELAKSVSLETMTDEVSLQTISEVSQQAIDEVPQEEVSNISANTRAVSEQKVMMVNKDAIVVRESSSTSSTQIGVLSKGDYVDVYEQNSKEGWSKINFQGKMSYVNTSDLGDVDVVYKEATENNVVVRSGAGDNYGEFGKLVRGERVQIYQLLSNGWTKVNYNGKIAFIQTVKLQDTYISKATVPVEKINVYSMASDASVVLGEAKMNEILFVYAEDSGYYKVRFGETFGYIKKDDLKLIQNTEKPQTGDAMVFSYMGGVGVSVLGLVSVNRKKRD